MKAVAAHEEEGGGWCHGKPGCMSEMILVLEKNEREAEAEAEAGKKKQQKKKKK